LRTRPTGRSLDEIAENSETMPRVEEHAEDGMNGMAARLTILPARQTRISATIRGKVDEDGVDLPLCNRFLRSLLA
jgi:hypothetical protein